MKMVENGEKKNSLRGDLKIPSVFLRFADTCDEFLGFLDSFRIDKIDVVNFIAPSIYLRRYNLAVRVHKRTNIGIYLRLGIHRIDNIHNVNAKGIKIDILMVIPSPDNIFMNFQYPHTPLPLQLLILLPFPMLMRNRYLSVPYYRWIFGQLNSSEFLFHSSIKMSRF